MSGHVFAYRGIYFDSFDYISIGFWKYSDIVVFLVFHVITHIKVFIISSVPTTGPRT